MPVAKGVIDFTSLDSEQPPVSANIVDGKYSAQLPIGNKQSSHLGDGGHGAKTGVRRRTTDGCFRRGIPKRSTNPPS